tara:strand:+ start:314 stop:562 length:249 start_codon:yes stop_codon:yes gene_type:complete
MNAKELFRKELNPADCWSEQTISFDFNDVTEFAERYLEHKLKLLGIGDVVGQSEQLPCEHERTIAGHHHDQPHYCLDCGEEL